VEDKTNSKIVVRACTYLFVALAFSSCLPRRADPPDPEGRVDAFAFSRVPAAGITFLSTQLNPVEEAGRMRTAILKDFRGEVDFRPNDNGYLFSQIGVIRERSPGESILVGALHGDLVTLYEKGLLRPLRDVYSGLEYREFYESLVDLGRLDGRDAYYVPWMQASFVMVANRKALKYLPKGADLDELSYDQLLLWAWNIFQKTGKKVTGFPAGKNGLMHRFFQGYLYPSFTGGTLLTFRNSDAEAMWAYFDRLWNYVHPASLTYSTMAEPLITEDVWIAWDHTARLTKAFEERPGDFVAFPAPKGPMGRGYMVVVSGLAVPAGVGTADDGTADDQVMLIDYLTTPAIQRRTLLETGFFPVVGLGRGNDLPEELESLGRAVDDQAVASDSIPTLLPVGLGERGSDFNDLYMLTFSEIVLRDGDAAAVLRRNAADLQAIIDETGAGCWLPDVSDSRPCKIE